MKYVLKQERLMAYDCQINSEEQEKVSILIEKAKYSNEDYKKLVEFGHNLLEDLNVSFGDYTFDSIDEFEYVSGNYTSSGKPELTININLTYTAEVEGNDRIDCLAQFAALCTELNTGDMIEIGDPCEVIEIPKEKKSNEKER